MEILESVAWITLGFLPMLGSMELVGRLSVKRRSKKPLTGSCLSMACYKSSIEALQQLLHLETQDRKIRDKSNTNVVHCHITKASKDVTDAKNGIEYYFVEVTCSNGTQYGLQAYGRKLSSFTMKHTDIEYCGRKKGHVVILSFNTWHTEQSTISYPYWSFIPAAFFFMAIKVFSHFFLIFSLRWSDSLVGGKIAFTSSAISFSSRIM